MAHAGGSSSGGGSAPESNWPNSLDQPATEEFLPLDSSVRLPPCEAVANQQGRLPDEGRPAPPKEAGARPPAPPAATPVPEEFDLPPEQIVLYEDGDPDDTPGLLVDLRASQATSAAAVAAEAVREEAEIAVAIQAAQALGAADPQPVVSDDDDDVDWDGLAVSSDDNDGSDGGGAGVGQDVIYVNESD
ncbi:hypothetical protein ZWY2020_030055 [Hordeum vulgare]|nr:hypothetical protein ZWY2020_030055 [Hordeum vulgare]